MSEELKLKRIQASERATYVAPIQVPQGESLEYEVFQALFISYRDFQASPKVFQTANSKYLYIDIGDAYSKIIKSYEEAIRD